MVQLSVPWSFRLLPNISSLTADSEAGAASASGGFSWSNSGSPSLWIGDSTVTGRYSQSKWHDYKACRACRRMNGFGSQVSMTWYELMRSRTTIVTIVSVAWTCSQVLDSKIPGDAQWVKGASHGGPARRSHPRGLRCSSEPGRVARHQNLGATQHI